MAIVAKKTVLSDLSVGEAMRMQVIGLPKNSSISNGIRNLFKFKINALLIRDQNERPAGVVSKTDIMGAYYAGLPTDSPLEHVMVSPPLFCSPDHSLESALDTMRTNGVYRLYVSDGSPDGIIGVLAYPDIVGLLYQYCRSCEYGAVNRRKHMVSDTVSRFQVKEVMTQSVTSFRADHTLSEIMEGLSAYRFGAVLITDGHHVPVGVVSKTDLMIAYRHGVSSQETAGTVLSSSRVISCNETDLIEDALRQMIFTGVHRLFAHKDDAKNIVGVFSLSDAARLRSGSCHACVSSRIRIDGENGT